MNSFVGGFVWPLLVAVLIGLAWIAVTRPRLYLSMVIPLFAVSMAAALLMSAWTFSNTSARLRVTRAGLEENAMHTALAAIDSAAISAPVSVSPILMGVFVGLLGFVAVAARKHGDEERDKHRDE